MVLDNTHVNQLRDTSGFALVVFLVAFSTQCTLWLLPLPTVDTHMWQEAALQTAAGTLPPITGTIAPHPGTTILIPGAFSQLMAPGIISFKVAMAFLISLIITSIIVIVRQLAPRSLWWLGVAVLFIPHALYQDMTPPSALAAALTALFVLLVLRAEKKSFDATWLSIVGICGGLLLSTRIDMGVVLVATSVLYITLIAGVRSMYLIGLAAISFFISDPYLWTDPLGQIYAFYSQVHANVDTAHGVSDAYGSSTLAIISYILGCAYLVRRRTAEPLSKGFLLWLWATATIFTIGIMLQEYHPLRYFFPFIMALEMLVPFFIISLTEQTYSSAHAQRIQYGVFLLFFLVRLAPIVILLS